MEQQTSNTVQDVWATLSAFVPSVVGALVLLVVGWIIALIVAGSVRKGLRRTRLIQRVNKWVTGTETADTTKAEKWTGRAVFALIMLFVLVGFFQILGLSTISEPITGFLNEIFIYAPRLLGPAILLVVAWVVAKVLKLIVQRALTAAKVDERLGTDADIEDAGRLRTSETIGEAVYWLTFLIFLPAILGALELGGLLEPVRGVVNKLLGYLPNLLGAAIILVIGWFVARIVRRLVVNLLVAIGTDRLTAKAGLEASFKEQSLSGLIGLIVYVLILVPVLIAALQALEINAVTQPASDMLKLFLAAIPGIFGAAILLAIAYIVGRLLAGLVTSLLAGVGFNGVLARIGLGNIAIEGKTTPAAVVGYIVLAAIMLFAIIEALDLMGFDAAADIGADFLVFAGNVILGLLIIGLGMFLANLVGQTVQSTSLAQAPLLSVVSRVAILVLAFAMGLEQMGMASEIILLAFGILLGAIALGVALAFGIGSRDTAGKIFKNWVDGFFEKKAGKKASREQEA